MCSFHCGGEVKLKDIPVKHSTETLKIYIFHVDRYAFDVHDESTMIVVADSLENAWIKLYEYIEGMYSKKDISFSGECSINDVMYIHKVTE